MPHSINIIMHNMQIKTINLFCLISQHSSRLPGLVLCPTFSHEYMHTSDLSKDKIFIMCAICIPISITYIYILKYFLILSYDLQGLGRLRVKTKSISESREEGKLHRRLVCTNQLHWPTKSGARTEVGQWDQCFEI